MPKKRSTATSPLAHFSTHCKVAFGPVLSGHGFAPVECEVGATTARQVFASGARYVEVSANLEPRDAPHYCAVSLGEGNRNWPEGDWNAVALWRMIADIEPARAEMMRLEIYPEIWDRDPEKDDTLGYLMESVSLLRQALDVVVARGYGL